MQSWTENDFDILDWCQSTIHRFDIVRDDLKANPSLVLDIDYVLSWDKPQPNSPHYRVAAADLSFHNVTDFQISMPESILGALHPIRIDYIAKVDETSWKIAFYDVAGEICFCSQGFTQTLTSVSYTHLTLPTICSV